MTKKSKEEIIRPYIPYSVDLIKRTHSDGSLTYRHPVGGEVETREASLDEIFNELLGRIEVLVGYLLDTDEGADFGVIFDVIKRDTEQQLDEALNEVEKSIGSIVCDVISYSENTYRHGRVVGARIKPVEGVKEVTS